MTPAQVIQAIENVFAENERLTRALCAQTATETLLRPNRKKLTKREVAKIRELSRLGAKNVDIAYGFDINRATVSRILRGIYHK